MPPWSLRNEAVSRGQGLVNQLSLRVGRGCSRQSPPRNDARLRARAPSATQTSAEPKFTWGAKLVKLDRNQKEREASALEPRTRTDGPFSVTARAKHTGSSSWLRQSAGLPSCFPLIRSLPDTEPPRRTGQRRDCRDRWTSGIRHDGLFRRQYNLLDSRQPSIYVNDWLIWQPLTSR